MPAWVTGLLIDLGYTEFISIGFTEAKLPCYNEALDSALATIILKAT